MVHIAERSFRTFPSRVQESALEALGAFAISGGDLINAVESGAINADDASWQSYLANRIPNWAVFVTAHTPLWPRALVIFATPDSLQDLSPAQRGWLSEAAIASSRWSTEHAGEDDTKLMVRACELGARIATASAAQQRELSRATPAPGTRAKIHAGRLR